jgi:type IV secretion system protein VirB10
VSGWSHLRKLCGAPVLERTASEASVDEHAVPGDRGVSPTYRATSLQTRLTNFVALGLGALVMTSFLAWYYTHALAQPRPAQAHRSNQNRAANAGMALPPLGRIDPPLVERVLGPAPDLREESLLTGSQERSWSEARNADRLSEPAPEPSKAPDRRLSGEAFQPASTQVASASSTQSRALASVGQFSGTPSPTSVRGGSELADLLEPTVLAAARAQVLPTRRLLLPKGAFLDCTLETAIDSSLPGMTTCVTATDTFGADGSVVLIERGSKLIGETRGEARAGSNRVFVLWSEARTPTGVVVPLASAGTDELGRSGLPGQVDRHFWDRFGAAILISVIDGAVQAAVQRETQGNSVTINPAGSSDIMTEVLKSTIHIAPTVTKRNGDRIAVLVARDLDFRSVYELRAASDRQ